MPETIGPNKHIVTITVDLNEVRALTRKIAQDNSGLETSSGLTVDDLDSALEVIAHGPATSDLLHLLRQIVNIHHEEHDAHK